MTLAATLRRIAQEFREHPEMWTREWPARDADGHRCDPVSPDAVSWCQSGRRAYYGITEQTVDVMREAARALFPGLYFASDVNDKLGREATIQMLELAADMMEGKG